MSKWNDNRSQLDDPENISKYQVISLLIVILIFLKYFYNQEMNKSLVSESHDQIISLLIVTLIIESFFSKYFFSNIFCIICLNKLCAYDFHENWLQAWFLNKAMLLMSSNRNNAQIDNFLYRFFIWQFFIFLTSG